MVNMNRIALLTSNSRRHRWLAARLSEAAKLVCVVTEAKSPQKSGVTASEEVELRNYFADRERSEVRWFGEAPDPLSQVSAQVREFPWRGGNSQEAFEFLQEAKPDRIFLFGSSIISDPILSFFRGRIVNMHLGLSPYYRGSATNLWPLVDGLPECVGVTVHHATAKVDGGGILSQVRPRIETGDNVHDVGCKAIMAGASLLQFYARLQGPLCEGISQANLGKLCRRADFGIDALSQLHSQLRQGMMEEYLTNKTARDARYPIVESQIVASFT
jgi:folate-dependent phosphoribosylglycinamide formyltransferase PurN